MLLARQLEHSIAINSSLDLMVDDQRLLLGLLRIDAELLRGVLNLLDTIEWQPTPAGPVACAFRCGAEKLASRTDVHLPGCGIVILRKRIARILDGSAT